MGIIRHKMTLSVENYYKKYLHIVSCILPTKLTSKEIDILSIFLSVDEVLTKDNMFNSEVRKIVMKELNMSNSNLSNYIKSMLNKKVLYRDEKTNVMKINKFLVPNKKRQIINLLLYPEK